MSVHEYSDRLKACILDVVIGNEIGSGCFRTVFALDEDRVLKVETRGTSFSNAHEWGIWNEVRGTKWEKWFAPCLEIDPYGAALIQARTSPLSDREFDAIKRVPNFMADLKRENWGMLDGRPVCHDYGNHRFFIESLSTAKMVKAR